MMAKASSDSKEHESMDMLYPANSDNKDNFLIGLIISMKNYPSILYLDHIHHSHYKVWDNYNANL